MITTIVVWPQSNSEPNPAPSQRSELDQYALSLSPEKPEAINSVLSDDGTSLTVTRSWPTVELAQAWVDHIMSTASVTSAVVSVVPD
jgi:hypothetical protein